MKRILIASENATMKIAMQTIQENYANYFTFDFCTSTEEVMHTIAYSLPEIKIIDFSSKNIDWQAILSTIGEDPWLHNGGIIAIAKDSSQVAMIENLKNINIMIVQILENFIRNFANLLRIVIQNPELLYNRCINDELSEKKSWTFIASNNPFDIQVYTNFLLNYLYSSNYIDAETRLKLHTVLIELLFNALEHGNCGIGYTEKTRWLEQGNNILDFVEQKNKDHNIAKKTITVTYTIGFTKSKFTIQDEGTGFNWKHYLGKKAPVGLHGMGISISESFVGKLCYNDIGNEVSFYIPSTQNVVNTIPSILKGFATIDYKDKDVVCQQNEPSNDLYFIVSGIYGVYVNKKLVATLKPKDMFIGEMAFLLNDRRIAAIVAIGSGKLIKVPKTDFVNLIRENPHYGLFLSRLLAQRLYVETQKTTKK